MMGMGLLVKTHHADPQGSEHHAGTNDSVNEELVCP